MLADGSLELASLPLLLAALWTASETALTPPTRRALILISAMVAIPLVQLIPLPAWLWTSLPGRADLVTAFTLTGRDLPWMPLSLAPGATWFSALSLLPPVAVFLATALLGWRQRRVLSLVIIALALVSVFLGLLQVAQGPWTALRFYRPTHVDDAVGFFANRNHFAALLYVVTLLVIAWAIDIGARVRGEGAQTANAVMISLLIAAFIIVVLLLAGQTVARSRAGIALMIAGLIGAFGLAMSDRRAAVSGGQAAKLMLAAVALVAVFAAQYALFRVFQRFEADPLADARFVIARNTIAAAMAYMPFGSGLGSFATVYSLFEKPQDLIAYAYVNHAHNDVLQVWMEAGVAGAGLILGFLLWFGWRVVSVWRAGDDRGMAIDRLLAKAATIAIALLLLHALVDYSLRTSAMMVVFAFLCALLVDPPARHDPAEAEAEQGEERRERHHRHRHREPRSPAPAPAPAPAPTPRWAMPESPLADERGAAPAPRPERDTAAQWPGDWKTTLRERSAERAPSKPAPKPPFIPPQEPDKPA